MVLVSISVPAGYLYTLAMGLANDHSNGFDKVSQLRTAGLVTLVVAVLLSSLMARLAKRLREKSLGLVAQMKVAEDELRQQKELAEKDNQAKSELLAVATHDLKNPLSAIVGMSDIMLDMKRSAPDPDTVKDDIDILESINTSAAHMFEIVRGILQADRGGAATVFR
uniref:histidine kinase dimerization/phospho-acceptor domain-containing protein n=1 Tax=Cephaloticoccus sp. TaxID=1985742 RepID=UPI00404AC0AC